MKIEIDLNEILGDEYGSESLKDSIKRQVIQNLTSTLENGISKKIDAEISKAIDEAIKGSLKDITPKFINELLDMEYTQVDYYGYRDKNPTTFRKQVLKALTKEMEYIPKSYDSDKNTFTKSVDSLVKSSMLEFEKKFQKTVDDLYIKQTLDFAVDLLKKKLSIK